MYTEVYELEGLFDDRLNNFSAANLPIPCTTQGSSPRLHIERQMAQVNIVKEVWGKDKYGIHDLYGESSCGQSKEKSVLPEPNHDDPTERTGKNSAVDVARTSTQNNESQESLWEDEHVVDQCDVFKDLDHLVADSVRDNTLKALLKGKDHVLLFLSTFHSGKQVLDYFDEWQAQSIREHGLQRITMNASKGTQEILYKKDTVKLLKEEM